MKPKPRRQPLPGLQVPGQLAPELRLFLEAIKERVEAHSGDVGDPKQRLATLRDLEAAGLGKAVTKAGYATLRSNLNGSVNALSASSSSATAANTPDAANTDDLNDGLYAVLLYSPDTRSSFYATWNDFVDAIGGGYPPQLRHAGIL